MANITAFAYSAVADKLGLDPKNEAAVIKLGHDAIEVQRHGVEARLAELRALSQAARDRAEAQRLAAGGLPVATITPMPARTRPYLQYGSVQSLAEVNTWCADPSYDWKLAAVTATQYGHTYILVRTVK